jgi:hypothetical protein
MALKDYTTEIGNTYGKLTITEIFREDKYIVMAKTKCACGNEHTVRLYSLTSGHTTSCGCLYDLTGKTFNRLTVLAKGKIHNKRQYYMCQCTCGIITEVSANQLPNGKIKSCGCLDLERKTTHNMVYSREYQTWKHVIDRCTNPNNDGFAYYGGRGISVCESWKKFENFYADMGPRPENTSLDRIDNNGNYEPGNCRWATRAEQARNRSSNVMLTYNGKTQCQQDWAKEIGITYKGLGKRLKTLSVEEALSKPLSKAHSSRYR